MLTLLRLTMVDMAVIILIKDVYSPQIYRPRLIRGTLAPGITQLDSEASDKRELEGLVNAAVDRLNDAGNAGLSYASRFDLAYNAVHGMALAALRTAGYRSNKCYMVFQCLVHTVKPGKAQAWIFSMCHDRRNLAHLCSRAVARGTRFL